MTASLILACVWGILANVIAMFPSKHNHWPSAYALIILGIPILGLVIWENGVPVGLAVLAAAVSILRWPVRYLLRWFRRVIGVPAKN